MEFYQTFFVDYSSLEGWTYDREKLETTRYEAGTYAHELEIYLANQSADGTRRFIWQIRAPTAPSIISLPMCVCWSTAERYSLSIV